MTIALILVASLLYFYFIGYRLYAGRIDRVLVEPSDDTTTPANLHAGDPDFNPAKTPVLFGHHFASIAGAGPIIGPIVALSFFGWAAVLLWILVGSVFIGAVHDYLTLMISARHDGSSVADIAGDVMSKRAKVIFGVFLYLTLVLLISVFGVTGAKTMVAQPSMVIPTFMVIAIAVLFGRAVYHKNAPLVTATLIAVGLNVVFLVIGYHVPVDIVALTGWTPAQAETFWLVVLLLYASVASVLPVELLLQPRDYISTYNLYAALILGMIGLMVVHPTIQAPAFIGLKTTGGPIWPMLFVLVACGAVSGFHSLVSGGTTSKQLARETDGRKVAFGGMLLEGVLAMMTLFLVASAFSWGGTTNTAGLLNFAETYKSGWIVVFGKGFGKIVADMLPFIGFGIASLIGMMTIKVFVLTTLDTAARITRFMVQETVGEKIPVFKNKYVALALTMIPAFVLGVTNSWKAIWPMFGASNQLIAALALFVISAYLFSREKPTVYTIVPGFFMLITTVGALVWQAFGFFQGPQPNYILGGTALLLILLAVFVAAEGLATLVKKQTDAVTA